MRQFVLQGKIIVIDSRRTLRMQHGAQGNTQVIRKTWRCFGENWNNSIRKWVAQRIVAGEARRRTASSRTRTSRRPSERRITEWSRAGTVPRRAGREAIGVVPCAFDV